MSAIEFTPPHPRLTLLNASALATPDRFPANASALAAPDRFPAASDRFPAEVLEAVRQARVILYDGPVNPELLKYAPANCVMRNMGCKGDGGRYAQKEINLITLQYLFSLGHVVRIKSIDPLAPGKGVEEVRYAQKFRIETAVISAETLRDAGAEALPDANAEALPDALVYVLDEGLKLAV